MDEVKRFCPYFGPGGSVTPNPDPNPYNPHS
jgi:hypothetical protein